MALLQPAMAIPREISAGNIKLIAKPQHLHPLSLSQGNSSHHPYQLVIYLNADKASWLAVIVGIISIIWGLALHQVPPSSCGLSRLNALFPLLH